MSPEPATTANRSHELTLMKSQNQPNTEHPSLDDERALVRLAGRFWTRAVLPPGPALRRLLCACGALALLDLLFLHPGIDKHAHFQWENAPWFYGIVGFVAYLVLVLVSEYLIRPLLRRKEEAHD